MLPLWDGLYDWLVYLCTSRVCVCVGPGEESPDAGGEGGGGASERTNQRAAGEEPATGEREPHAEGADPQHAHSITHTLTHTHTNTLTRAVMSGLTARRSGSCVF